MQHTAVTTHPRNGGGGSGAKFVIFDSPVWQIVVVFLTVPFWFRETQLKPYQKAYRIVDDGDRKYTHMEKSLMTSCVCTVGTQYADVAAQLFTAKVLHACISFTHDV